MPRARSERPPRWSALRHAPRLLACDLDGTLLDDRGLLRPAIREAVEDIRQSGVAVILATGRSPWSVVDIADALGLSGSQITMNGGLTVDVASGLIEEIRPLSETQYRQHLAFARSVGIDPIVAMPDGHRAERTSAELEQVLRRMPVEARSFETVRSLAALEDQRPIRTFLPTTPDSHRRVRMLATVWFGRGASIVSTDEHGIDLLAAGADKGAAVRMYAARRGIPMEAVAAVGDAENDVPMLRAAGWSAAMGDAPPLVRDAAAWWVPSSRDSGVLWAFRHFFPGLADRFAGLSAHESDRTPAA